MQNIAAQNNYKIWDVTLKSGSWALTASQERNAHAWESHPWFLCKDDSINTARPKLCLNHSNHTCPNLLRASCLVLLVMLTGLERALPVVMVWKYVGPLGSLRDFHIGSVCSARVFDFCTSLSGSLGSIKHHFAEDTCIRMPTFSFVVYTCCTLCCVWVIANLSKSWEVSLNTHTHTHKKKGGGSRKEICSVAAPGGQNSLCLTIGTTHISSMRQRANTAHLGPNRVWRAEGYYSKGH